MSTVPMHSRSRPAARTRAAATRALLGIAAVLSLTACSESTASVPESDTAYGGAVPVGNGAGRVYVIASQGAPVEVGVALSEEAFEGLPADHAPGGMQMPDGHTTYDYILPMPELNPTPYRFVGFGWNPAGHEPPGIYDHPHFDFHFYSITEAKRAAILPSDPAYESKAAHRPAPELVPAGYVQLPGAVPLMGAHWVDPNSRELNGQPFTSTLLYGSWDGELIFAEPMVTKAFLETRADFRTPIAVPSRYATAGYYPTEYHVYWNEQEKEYRVALSRFVERS
jgi:hypothetical protein